MRRTVCVLALTWLAVAALAAGDSPFHPVIPKAWDDAAVESMELPLAQRDRSPRYLTSAEYYALNVRPIYRSYPAYAAGREPAGYLDSLKQKAPEIIFDPSKLHTKADWIRAGKLVFESDTSFRPAPAAQPAPRQNHLAHRARRHASARIRPASATTSARRESSRSAPIPAPDVIRASLPDGSQFEGGQGTPNSPLPRSEAALRVIRELTPEEFQARLDRFLDLLWRSLGDEQTAVREIAHQG